MDSGMLKKALVCLGIVLAVVGCAKKSSAYKSMIAVLETTQGQIELEFFPEVAPKAVENFVTHVKNGYYDGVLFHRVIKDFMIQGGDPKGTGTGGESIWGGVFENEVKPELNFDRPGLLAMANRGRDTNGSQFFITTQPYESLNQKYTIFGEVYSGMDVVKKIESVKTGAGDRPVEDQKIIKATIRDYKLGE